MTTVLWDPTVKHNGST